VKKLTQDAQESLAPPECCLSAAPLRGPRRWFRLGKGFMNLAADDRLSRLIGFLGVCGFFGKFWSCGASLPIKHREGRDAYDLPDSASSADESHAIVRCGGRGEETTSAPRTGMSVSGGD